MRLVDADALPIVARGKNHHRKYVFADITDAPTIDAIPVEWMSKFCADDIAEDQRETIEWMLKVWKREQEAQDG